MKSRNVLKDSPENSKDDYKSDNYDAVADRVGIPRRTLQKWAKSGSLPPPSEIEKAFLKSRHSAIADAQFNSIKPIVEFYPIEFSLSKQGAKWELLPLQNATKYQIGVRNKLQECNGLYIFYDSRGKALYVGKAKAQSLWKEMTSAYNRARDRVQSIILVPHPEREQEFYTAYKYPRQPKDTTLKLHDMAYYFSAYKVVDGMIDDLEALLVRGFANDLLNIKMEKFHHFKTQDI